MYEMYDFSLSFKSNLTLTSPPGNISVDLTTNDLLRITSTPSLSHLSSIYFRPLSKSSSSDKMFGTMLSFPPELQSIMFADCGTAPLLLA